MPCIVGHFRVQEFWAKIDKEVNTWYRGSFFGSRISWPRFIRRYKRSAPRAADAARYARSRKISTKCEGGREKGPMI